MLKILAAAPGLARRPALAGRAGARQPLLAKKNPRDRGLPDFPEQYTRLCDALIATPQDVLVLSGDVHFGRVAEVEIERPGRGGARVYEVISSPMALVSLFRGRVALAAGRFEDEITEFPVAPARVAVPDRAARRRWSGGCVTSFRWTRPGGAARTTT